jgi:hypothetical protein
MKTPYGNLSMIDLSILDKDGCWFHICGENDWGYLLTEALQPLLGYALGVLEEIDKKLNSYDGKPEIIGLGKNEYRAVDILHRLRGCGGPIEMYKGTPITKLYSDNKIELFGFIDNDGLPF